MVIVLTELFISVPFERRCIEAWCSSSNIGRIETILSEFLQQLGWGSIAMLFVRVEFRVDETIRDEWNTSRSARFQHGHTVEFMLSSGNNDVAFEKKLFIV